MILDFAIYGVTMIRNPTVEVDLYTSKGEPCPCLVTVEPGSED